MTDPINVILWDSGHWRGKGGLSRPRILSAVRNLELTGQLRISEMRYVKTETELSKRLPNEHRRSHRIREEKRHKIQGLRVKRTADSLGYIHHEENLETQTLHPIPPDQKLLLIVVMPPGDERTRLITKLLRLENIEASLVIAPAVWKDIVELEIVIEATRNQTRVVPVPFSAYRFSRAMQNLAQQKNEGKVLEILQASVLSGKYPRFGKIGFRSFLSEFAYPLIDSVLHAVDSPIESGSIIYKETQKGRCPCLIINVVHKNGVVTVLNISAIAQFQTVNLAGTAFFSGTRLHFTDAFRDSVSYEEDGSVKSSEASRGHDAGGVEDRNGYATLLSNIINHQNNQNDLPVPTLESFRNTQAFLDFIFESLSTMKKKSQTHFTF